MRIILLSLAVAVFIIGLHQTFTVGASASYFIFMISLALIFGARIVKGNVSEQSTVNSEQPKKASSDIRSRGGKPKVKSLKK